MFFKKMALVALLVLCTPIFSTSRCEDDRDDYCAHQAAEASEMDLDRILEGEVRIVVLKSRLGSISWGMRTGY